MSSSISSLAAGETMLPGDVAFLLHDTYGFPLEVTQEIVAERNLTVDNDGVRACDGAATQAGERCPQGRRRRGRRRAVSRRARDVRPDRLRRS